MDISNQDDVIDSRDIIARIEELTDVRQAFLDGEGDDIDSCEEYELTALRALAGELEGYGDWDHGETLIRHDYFTDYTRELLTECGYLPADLPGWITIDWEDTAENVKVDYMTAEYDGVIYYMRA